MLRDALDADRVAAARAAMETDDSMTEGNQNNPRTEPFRSLNETLYEYATDLAGSGLLPPGHDDFGTVDGEETRVGLHVPDGDPSWQRF